ncbi:MAG: squalene synthase HpnD [Gammaproteobacteria bacterium]|jgi:phytoene synthase|nr:squalene synthase HpnD [Gammaproteobacteria bacterium]
MSLIAQETAPKGSSFYYSLLKVKEPKRSAIISLQAYANKLRKTSEQYSEAAVAKVKLNWWAEEIERMFQNQARHPISQTLQTHLETYHLPKAAFLALIEASLLSLQTQVFQNQQELAKHYQHIGGIVETLKCQVLLDGKKDDQTEQFSHLLGVSLETIRHIHYFAEFYHREQLYLPADSFQEFAEKDLASHLKTQADFARSSYQEALKHLGNHAKALKAILLYAKLELKLLDAIEKDGFQVLKHRIEISPIRKLWYAATFVIPARAGTQ